MSLIYVATNIVNNKRYVGKTTYSLELRMYQHINDTNKGSQLDFHKAIRKYGVDAFIWEELPCPAEGLNKTESYMIDKMNTVDNGYNMRAGDHSFKYKLGKSKMISTRINETQKQWLDRQPSSYSDTVRRLINNAILY